MGTRRAYTVGIVIFASVLTTVLTESPPVVDCGKPRPPRCPKNEEYRCENTCPGDGCINLYAAIDCIANQTCVSSCYCKKGYLRIGRGGPCVPPEQCPPVDCVSDSNARRGCGDKCSKTCGDYNSNRLCPKRPCKNDGCDCKDGYIHDTNLNKCVLPKDCTKPCKSHERWSPCLAGECVAKTCEDLGKPLACPAVANPCSGGCICDYGYVRAKNSTCMDAKKCPRCGDDANAEYGCGNPCGKTCASLGMNKSEIMCPQYCEVNGCDCKKGYLLNTNLKPPKCVLIKNCPKPPKKCGNNEEFYCGPSCPDSEASCSNRYPPTCINKKCELKCFCKKGYVRNANNMCIPADECPIKCTKKHEKYIDCLAGQCLPKDCDDLGKSLACPFIRGPCPGGCICEEGYLRHKGKCIKIEDCPPKPCGGNQTWMSPCNMPCPYPRCPRDDKPPPPCVDIKPCYPGCQCQPGYKRNSTGHCIQASDCPSVCKDPNASWTDCKAICPGTCLNPKPICISKMVCSPGCQCKKGYVLDDRKICVKIGKCPVKTTTVPPTTVTTPAPNKCPKPHEHFIECIDGQCRPKTCAQLITPAPCPRIMPPCPGGCICDDGYLRDAHGNCIKEEKCPKQCKQIHERWSECYLAECVPKTCDELGQSIPCYDISPPCAGGCICKRGYVRDKNGTCIDAKMCPIKTTTPAPITTPAPNKCPKPHEHFIECIDGQCKPKTCAHLITPAPCPRIRPPCAGGCICDDGYLRDAKGNCIKEENCPKTCKGANEEYTDCVNSQCTPITCKDVVKMPACPMPRPNGKPDCRGGCKCKNGYVRSNNGTCIAIKDCPEAGTCKDKNQAWVQCAFNCENNYCPKNDKPQPLCFLPAGICHPGCKCKPNYRIDNKTKQCIPARDCPAVPCTRQNEEYSSCPGNRVTSCAQLGTTPVKKTGPTVCYPGCICKKGFYKNDNNTCVSQCECR